MIINEDGQITRKGSDVIITKGPIEIEVINRSGQVQDVYKGDSVAIYSRIKGINDDDPLVASFVPFSGRIESGESYLVRGDIRNGLLYKSVKLDKGRYEMEIVMAVLVGKEKLTLSIDVEII